MAMVVATEAATQLGVVTAGPTVEAVARGTAVTMRQTDLKMTRSPAPNAADPADVKLMACVATSTRAHPTASAGHRRALRGIECTSGGSAALPPARP